MKKYNSALVPAPVSSSDEELSDSERDVSDAESGDSDTDNDVVDSDSEDVDSENDVVEKEGDEGEDEDEDEDEEGTEDEQPIGLLKKSTAGASSSKALVARASSSKALVARASSSKAVVVRASSSKAPAARASSSKAPAARASSSKAPAAGSSSSEAQIPESDSETESNMDIHSVSSPDSEGFTVSQIVVKPEKQEEVAETLRRRRGKQLARPSGSEVEKRRKRKKKRVDDIEGAERKKKKKKEADGGVPAGKPEKRRRFQRLWSEEDEIALLKGLGEYERRNGKNPFYEMGKFSEFIKKFIKIKVTARQLVDKARRLRRKFVKNVSRGKDGKDPIFKRLHDRRSFEVSKAVWGDGKLNVRPYSRGRPSEAGKTAAASRKRKREAIQKGKTPRKTQLKKKGGGGGNGNGGGGNDNGGGGNGNVNGNGNGNGGDFWSRYPSIRDSVDISPYLPEWGRNLMMERLIRNTPVEKLNDLEVRWKELRKAVGELHVRHLQLLKETMMLPEEATSNRQ